MHVLSVIHYPTFGGPHNRNSAVIPLLRHEGIRTTIVLPEDPGNASVILRRRGIDVDCLPLSRVRASRDPAIHFRFLRTLPGEVGRLRQFIRERQIDLVLVNGLANPHAAIAGHLEGVPVVWQLLDTFPPRSFRRLMMPLVSATADVVMCTGRAVAEAHPGAQAFGERLIFFFPVADAAKFTNAPALRARARQRLNIDPETLVVGNVSNLNLMKGHDTFIRAAARVRQTRPNTRFVILGSQAERHNGYLNHLWSLAADLGLDIGRDILVVDPHGDVAELAPAFDVFWLTSNPRSEGIPTVIGEAMAMELPVIATRVGSVAEAVDDGVTGRVVPPLDPVALATATIPYLDDGALRFAAGRASRERAELLYAPEACAERHIAAFALAASHRIARTHRRC